MYEYFLVKVIMALNITSDPRRIRFIHRSENADSP